MVALLSAFYFIKFLGFTIDLHLFDARIIPLTWSVYVNGVLFRLFQKVSHLQRYSLFITDSVNILTK